MSQAVERAQRLITKGEAVLRTYRPNPEGFAGFPTLDGGAFAEWQTQVDTFPRQTVGDDNAYLVKFREATEYGAHESAVETGIGILRAVVEDAEAGHVVGPPLPAQADPIRDVRRICDRFHLVARQLRQRHKARSTLNVQDEYDVQDLFHALLWLRFEDVRAEEYTPSYAGKSSRMDFLLKGEQVVVEIKKTGKALDAKELGSQLVEDIGRYQTHPDCKALICFVYDPEGLIPNPRGLERDLSRDGSPFPVHVFVRPM